MVVFQLKQGVRELFVSESTFIRGGVTGKGALTVPIRSRFIPRKHCIVSVCVRVCVVPCLLRANSLEFGGGILRRERKRGRLE